MVLACSMAGEKLTPLIIGNYSKPRCLNGLKEYPTLYEANSKAWMTSYLFTEYLISLNKKFKNSNRKIILFLDNCPAHPDIQLSNITLCFFPAKTTSLLQPLDQGIIHSVKAKYSNYLQSYNQSQIESKCDKIKLPDILDAMVFVKKAWDDVTSTTITNCFKRAFFQCITPDDISSDDDDSTNNYEIVQEDDIICRDPDENSSTVPSPKSDPEVDNIKEPVILTDEALSYLGKLHRFFKKKDPKMLSTVVELESSAFNLKKSESRQSKITDIFKPIDS